jgi:hypothetical protein
MPLPHPGRPPARVHRGSRPYRLSWLQRLPTHSPWLATIARHRACRPTCSSPSLRPAESEPPGRATASGRHSGSSARPRRWRGSRSTTSVGRLSRGWRSLAAARRKSPRSPGTPCRMCAGSWTSTISAAISGSPRTQSGSSSAWIGRVAKRADLERIKDTWCKPTCKPFWLSNLNSRQSVEIIGDPGRARTCDLPLRRRLLYPAELRGLARGSTDLRTGRSAGRGRPWGSVGPLSHAVETEIV